MKRNGVLTPRRIRLGGDALRLVVRNEIILCDVGMSSENVLLKTS